jgi:nucleoid-associated protein YgaU
MKKQWTASALVMALGLAGPVLAQDDPMPPSDPDAQTPADKTSSAERDQAAQQASAVAGEEYVVQKGDTLSGLAERFLGSSGQWKEIADANSISNPDMISVGQKLEIPQGDSGAEPAAKPMPDTETPNER